MKRILLLLVILIYYSIGYAQSIRSIHSNTKTNGKVLSIVIRDLYTQTSGTTDTVIIKQTFNNKGELVTEDESRVYNPHRPDTANLSKEMYRSWHTSFTYHYSSNDRLVKVTWIRDSTKGNIRFDKNGHPFKEEYISPGEYWTEIQKHYDTNGNLTHESTYYHNNFVVEDIYKYDGRDLEIERAEKGNGWHHINYYLEYQNFDNKGNWTRAQIFSPDHKPVSISIRDIKYAD